MRTYSLDNPVDPSDRPTWVDRIENPYLHGPYTPVISEITAVDLDVIAGEIPPDLYGAYFRNGPNPVLEPPAAYHWFDGDGMVHGVYFRDGRASYIRKWVQTRAMREEIARGKAELPGIMGKFDYSRVHGPIEVSRNPDYCKDTANTTLALHGGKLLAQWYNAGQVHALDPLTLETMGLEDFGGALHTTLNAHPKVDPRNGDYIDYDYSDFKPYYTYYVIGADGKLKHQTQIDLPGPRLPHDTTITTRYMIFHDFPLFHDPEALKQSGHRFMKFHRDLPTRFGVMPRLGTQEDIKWFEFEPGYVLHMVNAWEEGDWITMDGCFQPDPTIRRDPAEGPLASMLAYLRYRGHLHRWRMNLRTGESQEMALDDLNVEFCLPDQELYGVKTRYSYHQRIPTDVQTMCFDALVKYDHETGTREHYEYGPGWYASEAPFARSTRGGDEDSGYVITLLTQVKDHHGEAWIFDAKRISAGPVARVRLPSRVPAGFHATWVPGRDLWQGQAARA